MIKSFGGEFSWLSNFTPVKVFFEGECYPSVEHAYVAAKTLNKALRFEVKSCPSAGQAKRMGKSFDIRPDWNSVRVGIMESLLRQKFAYLEFAEKLKATGNVEIVEGNIWHDNFWGSCIC